MGSTYNGRIFSVIEEQNQPFEMFWDYQIFDFDGCVDPRPTARGPADRVRLHQLRDRHPAARRPGQLHHLRPGAQLLAAAGRRPKRSEIDMAPHMPTNPENQTNYLINNIECWADNQDELEASASTPGSPVTRWRSRPGPRRPPPGRTTGGAHGRRDRRTCPAGRRPGPDARRRRPAAEGGLARALRAAEAARADPGRAAPRLRPRHLRHSRSATCCTARWRTRSSRTPCRAVAALVRLGTRSARAPRRARLRRAARRPRRSPPRPAPTPGRHAAELRDARARRSLFRSAGRDAERHGGALPFEGSSSSRRQVGRSRLWQTIKLFSGPYTAFYLLRRRPAARPRTASRLKPPAERIYLMLFLRTFLALGASPSSASCSAFRSRTCWRPCRCATRTS